MSKPFVAALTGCIGSGKSAAAQVFRSLGAVLIDADELAREAAAPGTPGLVEIAARFGHDMLNPDGTLNRKKLRGIIFNDAAKRSDLENILHPRIRDLFLKKLAAVDLKNRPVIIYEVPLFFESRFAYPEINEVIVVSAPKEKCVERIMLRDSTTRESAEAALAAQLPIDFKTARAGLVIENTGSKEALDTAVTAAFAALKTKAEAAYKR